MNPLLELHDKGQAVWLDYIRRDLVLSGGLERMVREDGLRGVTSNPSIFAAAIGGSSEYDEQIRGILGRDPGRGAAALAEALAVADIQLAADVLRPVYDAAGGAEGFVSLEVAPELAYDTEGTIAEAERLWAAVDRPNLMIKVPATSRGVLAVEALLAAGINVNVTLMFSLADYEAVAQAYVRGVAACPEPHRVNSVASFFVSRLDTVVDRELETIGSEEALALRGGAAIANAKLAYQRFREIFHGGQFAPLAEEGARVQRPLWASTSTKNPAYRDVVYVEELIGPETVNTLPLATLEAFRDHGRARVSLLEEVDAAGRHLERLRRLGIDLDGITEQLQIDGVEAFARSARELLATVEGKRRQVLAEVSS